METVPPHVRIHSYGARGVYSTKVKTCEQATDSMGKVVAYAPSEYVPAWATASKRDACKGKQLAVSHASGGFGKIEYAPSAYEDKAEKAAKGKLGFCTSRPFGRNEVASMLDTLRYRDTLEKEAKYSKLAVEAAAAAAAAAGATSTGNDRLASTAEAAAAATMGLSKSLPKLQYGYDRIRHVPEFLPKVSHAERYERHYGSVSTSATSIGVGCFDHTALETTKHPKRDFTKAFNDKGHSVAPIIAGLPPTL